MGVRKRSCIAVGESPGSVFECRFCGIPGIALHNMWESATFTASDRVTVAAVYGAIPSSFPS